MALSSPRLIFGVHSVCPYSRSTGLPYGYARVIKDSSLALNGELIEQSGGANKYPWSVEDGKITAEMTLKFGEYPDFAFELFLGKAVTTGSAEASGNVSTLTDKYGTSVVDASTGIASVAVLTASKANLKFGRYVVKCTAAATVNLYILSDVDITRGTDVEIQDDNMKLLAADLTITTGGNTDSTDLGLRFTGGSGTIGMTTGDTATFEVRPVNSGIMTVRIGATTNVTPEFGCVLVAQKNGSDELFEVDAFRCKGSGLPIGFAEKAFSDLEAKAKLLYDSSKNGVFDIRHVKGA